MGAAPWGDCWSAGADTDTRQGKHGALFRLMETRMWNATCLVIVVDPSANSPWCFLPRGARWSPTSLAWPRCCRCEAAGSWSRARSAEAGPGLSRSRRAAPAAGSASAPAEAAAWRLVLQKVPSEANPKVRNHGEGPY